MRILQVRLANLNSLAGEWIIDLTDPAFVADGIFAITGPTGAGKTTILDAICLALYGRTPRLMRATKSDNEVMSSHTGECFAEASFETQAGRFRCHWSQRRARNKPDGELQQPQHEVADMASGQILDNKLRQVADRVEKITGMDFDRFTRSMMLAQGGFASFLQADADQRAPILEQITGTDIYSHVSVRVHEINSEHRHKLKVLEAELSGMTLLSDTQIGELKQALATQDSQLRQLNEQIATRTGQIAWLERMAAFQAHLTVLGERKVALHADVQAFSVDQQRLAQANKALELAGDYAKLCSIRELANAAAKELAERRAALPASEATLAQKNTALVEADALHGSAVIAQQEAEPVLRRVRELDVSIAERDKPMRALQSSISDLTTVGKKLDEQLVGSNTLYQTKTASLAALQKLLRETAPHERLGEQLSGIASRFEQLREAGRHLSHKQSEIAKNDAQLQALITDQRALSDARTNAQQQLTERVSVLSKAKNALDEVLQDKSLSHWRSQLTALTDQQGQLLEAKVLAQRLHDSRIDLNHSAARIDELKGTQKRLQHELPRQTELVAACKRALHALQNTQQLLMQMKDLEQLREHLHNGEPCPLCGATEHPFADHKHPSVDENSRLLEQAKQGYDTAHEALAAMQAEQNMTQSDLNQQAVQRVRYQSSVDAALSKWLELSGTLPLVIEPGANEHFIIAQLEREADQTRAQVNRTRKTLVDAEATEQLHRSAGQQLEMARQAVTQASERMQAHGHQQNSLAQAAQRLANEAQTLQVRHAALLGQLQQQIAPYGADALSNDDSARGNAASDNSVRVLAQLEQWARDRASRAQQATLLTAEIATLLMRVENYRQQRAQNQQLCADQSNKLKQQRAECEALQAERQTLLPDQTADARHAGLAETVRKTKARADSARTAHLNASREQERITSAIANLEKAIAARNHELTNSENAFQPRLREYGFANEAQYLSACLPVAERAELDKLAAALTARQAEINASEKDTVERLGKARALGLTDQSLDALKEVLTTLNQQRDELTQKIGGTSQKLTDNDTLKETQQQRLLNIAAQQRESQRWEMLHGLIGSADGKKYRNFAQGLTFELMVRHANAQLARMTDRYLLARDDTRPLQLNVVDNYQAGQIRSTRNLSGGESFIVSLSLALGLSQMASKNVRVDSLFLDEGFGTLDDEALDTALDTLSGLQQEGKLIGVISHVAALKERITTQIQVVPVSGGRSELLGPGCRRGKT